jgi:hypothetical protein
MKLIYTATPDNINNQYLAIIEAAPTCTIMQKLFKAVPQQHDNGWFQMSTGNSAIDMQDYVVTTEYMRIDELPEEAHDAKTFAELVCGLLNAYYNKVDVSSWDSEKVMNCGRPDEETEVPHVDNPELPF